MTKTKHNFADAVKALEKKKDIRIQGTNIIIDRSEKASQDVGNSSWGKIDFLVKYHKFQVIFDR